MPCSAHCVSTCDDPDPVCARICVPGCGCPRNLPMWYQGGCIPRVLCPPPTGNDFLCVPVQKKVRHGRKILEQKGNHTNCLHQCCELKLPELGLVAELELDFEKKFMKF